MKNNLDGALTGISGILVTPFDDAGEVAPNRLKPIIDRALGAGVHLPVVNGNTGEFYALTTDEACIMVQEVTALVSGRAPVIAGVGRSNSRRLPPRKKFSCCRCCGTHGSPTSRSFRSAARDS